MTGLGFSNKRLIIMTVNNHINNANRLAERIPHTYSQVKKLELKLSVLSSIKKACQEKRQEQAQQMREAKKRRFVDLTHTQIAVGVSNA
jgi:hypothetical protein